MFRKKQRLYKKREIDAVFKGRISVYNKYFGLKSIKNNLEHNRYVIIIGTKVNKLAVKRNKIKRQIKAFLKESEIKISPPQDMAIIVLKEADKLDFLEIKKYLGELIKKAGTLKL